MTLTPPTTGLSPLFPTAPSPERLADDDALLAVLTGILAADTAYDVVQGLLASLCTHAGWTGAAYWTPEPEAPRRMSLYATAWAPGATPVPLAPRAAPTVHQAFTTTDLVLDPTTDALLALPLVVHGTVVGVAVPIGEPPVVSARRAEVLRYLACRSASALTRRSAAHGVRAHVASVERDLAVLSGVIRAAQEGRAPLRVAMENDTLDELAAHLVELVGRLRD